jgi:hypothetical protein
MKTLLGNGNGATLGSKVKKYMAKEIVLVSSKKVDKVTMKSSI